MAKNSKKRELKFMANGMGRLLVSFTRKLLREIFERFMQSLMTQTLEVAREIFGLVPIQAFQRLLCECFQIR